MNLIVDGESRASGEMRHGVAQLARRPPARPPHRVRRAAPPGTPRQQLPGRAAQARQCLQAAEAPTPGTSTGPFSALTSGTSTSVAPTTTPTRPGSATSTAAAASTIDCATVQAVAQSGALHPGALGIRRGRQDEHTAPMRGGGVQQRPQEPKLQVRRP